MRSRPAVRVGIFTLLIFIAVGAAVLLLPEDRSEPPFYQDTLNAKQMVETIRKARVIHAAEDGRIDVYRTVFAEIQLDEGQARILFSWRMMSGPTVEQIRQGDYSSFAWERARADDVRNARGRVPILWYPQPFEGERLVGFADGAVIWMTERQFNELRIENR